LVKNPMRRSGAARSAAPVRCRGIG
jgi:hypothetical protein